MTFEELQERGRIQPVGLIYHEENIRIIYKYNNSTELFVYIDSDEVGMYLEGITDASGKMETIKSANGIIAYMNDHKADKIVGAIVTTDGYIIITYVDGDTYKWHNTVTGETGETNLDFEVDFDDLD